MRTSLVRLLIYFGPGDDCTKLQLVASSLNFRGIQRTVRVFHAYAVYKVNTISGNGGLYRWTIYE
jgi:hypothetical protein